jgi:3-methylcrotonyl-CoA carboxylase beta subunit
MATLTSTIDRQAKNFQANAEIYDGLLKTLHTRQAWSLAGGGDRMVQRHRDRGKIPVRERIDLLIDPFSPSLEALQQRGPRRRHRHRHRHHPRRDLHDHRQ